MPDRRPSPDDPHWGPARTYRAGPGRADRSQGRGVPIEDISEDDLIEPDGGYTGTAREQAHYASDAYPEEYDAYAAETYPDDDDADGAGSTAGSTYRRARREVLPRRRRRRHPVRWAVVLVLLLLVGYPLALAQTAMTNLHRVDALSGAADTPGRNYLVVGSDSRSGTDLESVQGQRTDTIMLMHVPSTGPTVILSLPRDSEVKIPGHGKNKVNAAYAIGGPELLVQTVEEAIGIRIDGYVETGLAGFGDIVDAVGGIEVCPKFAMDDKWSGLNVQPGCQQVDGTVALAYARNRHADPRGDLGRVDRQREVIAAIAKKAASPATLINPFSSFPLAKAGGQALTVDNDLGMVQLAYFLYGMKNASSGAGISLTVPVARTDRMTDHGQVVDWDKEQAEVVFTALRDSSTEGLRTIADEQAKAAAG